MKFRLLKHRKDEDLLRGLANKDREVLHGFYELYFPMIRNMVLQNSGNEEAAKDLFQDALMVLYDKAREDGFVLSAQLQTYLYAICRRLWLKQLRDRKNDPIFPNEKDEETMPELEEDLTNHEAKEQQFKKLHEALGKLGSPCKELLEDFYMHKFSMQQLSEKFDYTNTNNAKTQKYKCLQRLKKIFFQQNAGIKGK